ncbi:nuclear body protein SP140-like protein [Scyliorhinus canicula]|uniref:nuclear body protein SP140-like protein n=1 Tax=Scyliorhinus canicula TaxID=7830 RepID=UPI0018F59F6E|nr:nuclear body protein SP140-like protein [Scyliorhinus canicula]
MKKVNLGILAVNNIFYFLTRCLSKRGSNSLSCPVYSNALTNISSCPSTDLGKDVPVVKTGLCVTGKRKYPDEECADHSVSGRTQKDVEEQIPECSTDPNWKRNVELQQAKKDGKPNEMKTRKPPPPLGKDDFDSNLLPVSCGDITGLLDKTQLALGSRTACIKYKDDWYTPCEFEVAGGRERSKNWKVSIQCKGYRLSKLLEMKYLMCESPTKKRKVKAACAEEPIGLMKKSTIQREDGSSDERRKDAEDPEMADFSSNELPVACSSLTGILHKHRFITGINGKCIRMGTKWLTPSEFENLSDIRKEIRYWKRNIHCKSKSLGELIQRGHLKLHKRDCLCKKCTSPPDCDSQKNDDECTVCQNRGKLICCDQCLKAFHFLCHVPSLSPNLSEKFICTFCKIGKLSANKTRSSVSNNEFGVHQTAMTPQYILKCEYILLQLYCKQVSVMFDKNPCETIPNYSDVIENPMWLRKVKKSLATNEYQIVGGFIDDMRLIFHNRARFNKDNELEAFGRNLSAEFEEIMMQVFDISNNDL